VSILPARIPKKAKRESRWRSQRHCTFVRSHACCNCGETAGIEVAHVRMGSGAGMGQRPHDYRTVSLCKDCHVRQHSIGERTFWEEYRKANGCTVEELIQAYCKASPVAREIKEAQNAS
jgi:hypothetical protein